MDPKRAPGRPHASGDRGRRRRDDDDYYDDDHDDSSSGGSSPASPARSPAPHTAASSGSLGNAFANDGSFMEMFKKKMEEEARRKTDAQRAAASAHTAAAGAAPETGRAPAAERKPTPVTSFVGKRRGGVFLKTGMVAKKQKEDVVEPGKSDAWSSYMAEVKKYKAHQCGDDDKTRPLVK